MKKISVKTVMYHTKTATMAYALALLASIVLISSCSKSNNSASTDTATINLTSAPWQRTKVEWQTTAGVWVDRGTAYNDLPISAGTVTFSTNGTYLLLGGKYGTWNLSADKTQLNILTSFGASSTITVAALTTTSLQLTIPLTGEYTVTNNPYTITNYTTERDTYTH